MRLFSSLAIPSVLVVGAILVGSSSAAAGPSEHPTQALDRFASALTSGNSAAVRAECTDAFWARLSSDVGTQGHGTFVVLPQTVGVLRDDLASGSVVWTRPDGVQDVVDVRLSAAGSTWKVCGGLSGGTPARPLQR